METRRQEIRIFITQEGHAPFSDWLNNLRDIKARAKIRIKIDRLRLGNLGDHKSIGEGISELRVDYGPGYRIYFGQDGNTLIILLSGGTKKKQNQDIKLAQEYWKDYRKRKNE